MPKKLKAVPYDFTERIAEMRSVGIKRIAVLDSGTGEDCAACHALTVGEFPIDAPPPLPPPDCTCPTGNRLVVIAVG